MKIEDLRLFTTVVDLGSFTAAANALDLPRANVSRRISELEKKLGIKLFFRTTRRLSLTPHGSDYYKALLDALTAMDRASAVALRKSDKPMGKVKLGMLPESDESIQPILFKFQDIYPEIELDIRNINNGFTEMYPLGLDVVIHGGDLHEGDVIAKKVFELSRYLVASPEYLRKNSQLNSIDDLVNHQCVCFRWPSGELDKNWQIGGKTIAVQGRLCSNNIGFVKRAVLQHRGIGFLPTILIKDEIKNGQLVKLLATENFSSQNVWVLYPERKSISFASQLLVDFLIQEIPKLA